MAACQPPVWGSCRIPCGSYQTVISTQFARTLEQQIKQTERDMAAIDQVARPFDPNILSTAAARRQAPSGRSRSCRKIGFYLHVLASSR